MRFSVINLGCKVNRVESDSYENFLTSSGAQKVSPEYADLIIINTCTVTAEAEKKTRKVVRSALRGNSFAALLVTGCASAISANEFLEMDTRVEVVPKEKVLHHLRGLIDSATSHICLAGSTHARVGVKVQDGCNNACTYCIVHVARGVAKSRPSKQIIADCISLAQSGVKEIVLSGINLGTYDLDGLNLSGLLRILLEETSNITDSAGRSPRFRVSSIEPRDVDESLIELLATSKGRVCRHLHLPLQSGSSKVLREMARPYDAKFFSELICRIRSAVPTISISTDVIAGFPGETDEDFQQTIALSKASKFSKMHVFPYSMRAGTPAALRKDQIESAVKAARATELRELSAKLREEDYLSRCNTSERAVVEICGRACTESYYEVEVSKTYSPGNFVEVLLKPELRTVD
ncbi:MiaB/RimO family radical SAM methylthiotransferase [Adlercreutzia sp. ZJ154]|uniref:MiaB/RimO family radical SAM methylthiotransferase n=1 Tax=Adlercreutzia sp. ZJ154 TaxID=2709790 RepID=UPI0013EAC610|nr:MiaB/RimO family radical SAM methylthiotransferase [Adlercreutzia sp. ZJ154]